MMTEAQPEPVLSDLTQAGILKDKQEDTLQVVNALLNASTQATSTLTIDEGKTALARPTLNNGELKNIDTHSSHYSGEQTQSQDDIMDLVYQKLRTLGKLRYSNIELEFAVDTTLRLDERILLKVYDTSRGMFKTKWLLRATFEELFYLKYCSP